jgi:NAD-dependent dihydropyrimidine dehydrogenase PreA subunit
MDINKELQKCYEMCHLSAVEVKQKSETIDGKSYVVREERNAIVTYWIHGNV